MSSTGIHGHRSSDNEDSNYAMIFDDTNDPILYLCEAVAGSASSSAVWRVKRIDTTNGGTITWADGNTNFDNIADNRASLSYS